MSMKESENEVAQSCPTLCNPRGCSLPGSSVHGIFQAWILEWVAIAFSRGSSRPRDRTRVSRIVGRCFTVWAIRDDFNVHSSIIYHSQDMEATKLSINKWMGKYMRLLLSHKLNEIYLILYKKATVLLLICTDLLIPQFTSFVLILIYRFFLNFNIFNSYMRSQCLSSIPYENDTVFIYHNGL